MSSISDVHFSNANAWHFWIPSQEMQVPKYHRWPARARRAKISSKEVCLPLMPSSHPTYNRWLPALLVTGTWVPSKLEVSASLTGCLLMGTHWQLHDGLFKQRPPAICNTCLASLSQETLGAQSAAAHSCGPAKACTVCSATFATSGGAWGASGAGGATCCSSHLRMLETDLETLNATIAYYCILLLLFQDFMESQPYEIFTPLTPWPCTVELLPSAIIWPKEFDGRKTWDSKDRRSKCWDNI